MLKYSSYKPSNVEWLGAVPSHWKLCRLKDVIEFNPSIKEETLLNDELVTVLPMECISDWGKVLSENFQTLDEVDKGLTSFKNGDVIFAKITPCVENGKGAYINILKTKVAFGSTEFFVLRPTVKSDRKFIYWLTRNEEFRKIAALSMRGAAGQQRVPSEFLKLSKFGFPIKSEQTAIANYLDQATAKIDNVIAAKQKQLEKLEQYKQSKIHECVTKGLKPDVPFKDSGIDWIGEVPSHWKVERVKDVVQLRNEKTSEKSEVKDYLELEDMEQWTGKIIGFRDTTEVSSDVTIFKKGDILFGKLRPYLAKYWLADRDGKCTGEIISFSCLKIQNVFFKYFIGSPKFIELCTTVSYGAKMPRVDWTRQIAYFYISFPDKDEQIEIADYLDNFCEKLSNEKSIIEQQIEKLKLYRKCLIHECVTGKRKVAE